MALALPTRVYRPSADVKAATLAALARGKGVVHTATYATADCSGWCDNPIIIDQMGDSHRRMGPGGVPVREPARTLSTAVRCRRCEGCRRETRFMWAKRAVKEWIRASQHGGRTWFVTLTFRPEEHYKLQTKARLRLREQGIDLDALGARERYAEVLEEYNAELKRFLDRLRKGRRDRGWDVVKFRYVGVPEPHQSGHLHYHLLLHETSLDAPLVKRRIEEAWGLGFVNAKLVTSPEGTLYTTKYLGKHHYEGRIRVSKHYGEDSGELPHAERVNATIGDWLWETERDPDAEAKTDVEDLRAPVPAVASESYGEGDRDEQARLHEPAFPGDMTPRRGEPSHDPLPTERALRIAAVEASADDDGADPVRIGDYLGVCASGLHIGNACDCGAPSEGELECVGFEEPDEWRGVPRRKWKLRGWHETTPGRGAPGVPRPYKRKLANETQH